MSDFNNALALIKQRHMALTTFTPRANEESQIVLERAQNRLAQFVEDNQYKQNFDSTLHPAAFLNVETLAHSKVKGQSVAQARGHGALSTVVDKTRSIGHGFRHSAPRILNFLELVEPDEDITYTVDQRTGVTYPVFDLVEPTNQTFSKLKDLLTERTNLINRQAEERGMYKSREQRALEKEEKERLLILPNWSQQKIIEYSIEAVSRIVVQAMDSGAREELVKEPHLPFVHALEAVPWRR
jgi:hypothetical protein